MRFRYFFILILLVNVSYAQQIENLVPTLAGNNIEISYDLIGPEGTTYDLQLYSSIDNFTTPLKYVSGDIGEEIASGTNKKVIWEARKELTELGTMAGEITFEISGNPTPPPFNVSSPKAGQTLRRGKSVQLEWQSRSESQFRVDLYQSGTVIDRIGTLPNSGTYNWNIPKSVGKGKGYELLFTSTQDLTKSFKSPQFIIGPQIGSGLKIGVAAILVGTGVCIISDCFGGGGGGNTDIPYPIEPN